MDLRPKQRTKRGAPTNVTSARRPAADGSYDDSFVPDVYDEEEDIGYNFGLPEDEDPFYEQK